MESQPQNPEFRINPENFHICYYARVEVQNLKILNFRNSNLKTNTMITKVTTYD